MKNISGYMVFMVCLVCISSFYGIAAGADEEVIDTGKVIEIAVNEHIIQVKNRNYIVTDVYIDNGATSEPVIGLFRDIKVGSIVKVYVNGKKNGFWQAKKVILYTGEKEEAVSNNLK